MLRIFPWLQFWNTEKHISLHSFLFWLITSTSNKKYKHYLTVNIKNNTTHIRKRVWVKKVRPKYFPFFVQYFCENPVPNLFSFSCLLATHTQTDTDTKHTDSWIMVYQIIKDADRTLFSILKDSLYYYIRIRFRYIVTWRQ